MPYETFRKNFSKKIGLLIKGRKNKDLNILIFSNSLVFFEEIIINLLTEFCIPKNSFKVKLITKNKINLKNSSNLEILNNDINSYNLKIFLQTDNENNEKDLKYFKNINASKSSIIPCSLTGE